MPRKKREPEDQLSAEEVEAQVAAFLKAGGKITVIPRGTSAFDGMAPGQKHLVLNPQYAPKTPRHKPKNPNPPKSKKRKKETA